MTGPRNEIDSLASYLRNEVPSVRVVKSTPHIPFWKSFKDLFLLVYGKELEEAIREKFPTKSNAAQYLAVG